MTGSPWGGSEELWSQAAARLAEQGLAVSASVHGWSPPHRRVQELQRRGVAVDPRPAGYPAWRRVAHRLAGEPLPLYILDLKRWLKARKPALVALSSGGGFGPVELVELCAELALPFVTITQANHEGWWPEDDHARRLRTALPAALRCYFVSEANRKLAEKQIGCHLPNAEVVRNPFNVGYDAAPPWPIPDSPLRMACVARLEPPAKGQDLLLEVLAEPLWKARDWTLALCGSGPNREGLLRLAERLGLRGRVEAQGHVDDVAGIWAGSHMLVLPSRYEGLPLALVEAMLCHRAALVTDVAGNGEVVTDGATGFLAESATAPALRRALERAWERRSDLRRMGQEAGRRIRELVPRDPAGDFVRKLKGLVDLHVAPGRD
jgi:glycosyltransferase involved in cell wall biosynthesis